MGEQELVGEMMFEETILRNARRKLKDWRKKSQNWTQEKTPQARWNKAKWKQWQAKVKAWKKRWSKWKKTGKMEMRKHVNGTGRLLHEYAGMLSSTDGSDDLTQTEQELVGEMMFEETILRNARRKLKDWRKKGQN